jgi:hypothetical protein
MGDASWEKAVSKLYRGVLTDTGKRSPFLEGLLSIDLSEPFTTDDRRNLPHSYSAAFSGEGLTRMEALFEKLLGELRHRPYAQADEIVDAIEFVQGAIMTAWVRHELSVGQRLMDFCKGFDRLDVPEERRRLYGAAASLLGV